MSVPFNFSVKAFLVFFSFTLGELVQWFSNAIRSLLQKTRCQSWGHIFHGSSVAPAVSWPLHYPCCLVFPLHSLPCPCYFWVLEYHISLRFTSPRWVKDRYFCHSVDSVPWFPSTLPWVYGSELLHGDHEIRSLRIMKSNNQSFCKVFPSETS